MKNEILEELWKVKDQVANEYGYNIEKLAKGLRTKEKEAKATVVDLTRQVKSITKES
jgi:hypothetical protein